MVRAQEGVDPMTATKSAVARAMLVVALGAAVLVAGCSSADGYGAGNTVPGLPSQAASAPADAQFAGAPEGTATIASGTQSIGIDVSKGFYDPTIVHVKAGVPVKLKFGQGQGCLARVLIPDFNIDQDLTQGGATVELPALSAGEYGFSCGMRMVFGKIVAQ
jgi:hypothetical protein